MTYDPSTDVGKVRMLINDVDESDEVFTDPELEAFLALEGDAIKLAAAQAIDSQATNEALAAKVLKDHQLSTDGAKLADALRKHAANLRTQHYDAAEADGYFEVVDFTGDGLPELADWAP